MIQRTITILLTLMIAISCEADSTAEVVSTAEEQRAVSFSSSSSLTRLDGNGDMWVDHDAIGITMWEGDMVYNDSRNIEYTASYIQIGSSTTYDLIFTPKNSSETLLYPRNTAVSFSAYYPRTTDVDTDISNNNEMTYMANLSTLEFIGEKDLLFATTSDYDDTMDTPVALTFDHMLSRLEIYIIHSLSDIKTLEGLTVTLEGVANKARYVMTRTTMENYLLDCEKGDIEMNVDVFSNNKSAKIVALLNPNLLYYDSEDSISQMTCYDTNGNMLEEDFLKIENATLTFTIPNGSSKELVYTTDTFSLNPQRGKVHRFFVELGNDIITFVSDNEIVDWVDSDGDETLDEFMNEL